jgi:hypothetical protein
MFRFALFRSRAEGYPSSRKRGLNKPELRS